MDPGSIVAMYSGSEIGGKILENWGEENGWRWGYGLWCSELSMKAHLGLQLSVGLLTDSVSAPVVNFVTTLVRYLGRYLSLRS